MNGYDLWVFLHVTSVIVWLGSGTTLALITLYARQTRDVAVLEHLPRLAAWLGPRVFAPASLGTLVFGVVAARSGHWPSQLWLYVGVAAFAISFLLNVAVRLPLIRRMRRGAVNAAHAGTILRSLALVELAILFLTVADMIAKPT